MKNNDFQQILHKGTNVKYEKNFTVFSGHKNIFLGKNIHLVDTLINAGDSQGEVIIEDYVFFGHGVKILARGHNYNVFDIQRQKDITEKPIHIKQGAWLSSGVIVLGGTTIGKHAVVAAGSVVVKDVPDYAIVGGNPAKLIKYINRKFTLIEKIKNFFSK